MQNRVGHLTITDRGVDRFFNWDYAHGEETHQLKAFSLEKSFAQWGEAVRLLNDRTHYASYSIPNGTSDWSKLLDDYFDKYITDTALEFFWAFDIAPPPQGTWPQHQAPDFSDASNSRRVELLKLEAAHSLSPDQERELDGLQEQFYKNLEKCDPLRFDIFDELEKLAQREGIDTSF